MKPSEIMTREVVAVASDTPIRDVAELMVHRHITTGTELPAPLRFGASVTLTALA